ncbi:MAG: branched-chain amino acid ABC transporter permease [bacterium]
MISGYTESLLVIMGINLIAAVSYNLINGYTGQFSLGHAGFMAVGGFTAAILTKTCGWPMIPSFLLGGLMAGFVGLLVGWPTLRLKGDYLAIATLGVGEIIRVLITNLKITGGAQGIAGLPSLDRLTGVVAWKDYYGRNPLPAWVEFLPLIYISVFVILTVAVIWNLIHSPTGRAIISVREDEIAADAMGVNTTYYKVLAFVIGSFFAGLAGAWQVHNTGVAAAEDFNLFRTIEILTFIVLGGLGSTTGAIIAAVGLTWLAEKLKTWTGTPTVSAWFQTIAAQWDYIRLWLFHTVGFQTIGNPASNSTTGLALNPYAFSLGPLWRAIFSLLLIIVMLARPAGLMGRLELPQLFQWRRRRPQRPEEAV